MRFISAMRAGITYFLTLTSTLMLLYINTFQPHKSGKLPEGLVEISVFIRIEPSSRLFSLTSASLRFVRCACFKIRAFFIKRDTNTMTINRLKIKNEEY